MQIGVYRTAGVGGILRQLKYLFMRVSSDLRQTFATTQGMGGLLTQFGTGKTAIYAACEGFGTANGKKTKPHT